MKTLRRRGFLSFAPFEIVKVLCASAGFFLGIGVRRLWRKRAPYLPIIKTGRQYNSSGIHRSSGYTSERIYRALSDTLPVMVTTRQQLPSTPKRSTSCKQGFSSSTNLEYVTCCRTEWLHSYWNWLVRSHSGLKQCTWSEFLPLANPCMEFRRTFWDKL